MKNLVKFLILFVLAAPTVFGAKIGDITSISVLDQALRFFTFQDPSVRIAIIGAILLGFSSSLLGSFLVVKGRSLLGDTISHAVLPGVALGFLVTLEKDPAYLFIGASVVGFISVFINYLLHKTTILKVDASMGLILAFFYGLGICLLTMIQNMPFAKQSGLDKFLFGQASSLAWEDINLMVIVTLMSILLIFLLYKEFLTSLFDPAFASSIGFPLKFLNALVTVLVTFAVVISIKAVGVVLVSAMLIIPPATAILLVKRFHHVLFLSAIVGIVSAIMGVFLSFIAHNLPTGPFMVISAAFIFVLVFLFNPKSGVIPEYLRHRDTSVH